ncbi:outer membrane biosynthesis protein TonB [Nocardia transvalensis]|uniref:Outer membrane biosynthesis protein TonB n=1 Tax=Nocardia transvalensis TaxID=37333 RepID=A0A7W9PIT1_9NOCA|nr:hypothetical protein [Nocardia transvalensis]MBB5916881.1 outer membrane biosynthesis protein TonB [Nocardia transvalensis]
MPVTLMAACCAVAVAASVPDTVADQPGVTTPAQPGTSTPPPPPPPPPPPAVVEPEPAPAPAYAEQPPQVRNGPQPRPRPEPSPEPVAPVQLEDLHLPEPVPPVAPIQAPDNTIRLGQWETPSSPWLPPEVRDCVNTTAADAEAALATALDSVGLPAGRSDRVSGAALAGAAIAAGTVGAGFGAGVGVGQ